MKIVSKGIIDPVGPSETLRVRTFPTLTALSNGTLLLTCRVGSTKDSDDGTILAYRSSDNGRTWGAPAVLFAPIKVEGIFGSFHLCYVTELEPGHLLAACLWVDRETYPGQPLFNANSGCLPMAILLSDSFDGGATWSPLRGVPLPAELGPPSLTSPVLKLHGGVLALSVETNKTYLDTGKWRQKVVLCHSTDGGKTWGLPVTAGCDPAGRIFNWDQRAAVAPDGTIGAFLWTFDSETQTYLNIHRRLSRDNGMHWSEAEDLGFTDQAGHPAVSPDGRVVLCWVDRFKSHTIRVRTAPDIGGAFDARTEIELYHHDLSRKNADTVSTTGEALGEMGLWTYGLPYAEVVPGGDVLVFHYAGDSRTMNIHVVRLGCGGI